MQGGGISQRAVSAAAVLAAALSLTACGVTSPQTPLPPIDRSQPATLLNKSQQAKVFESMGKLAEQQNQQAAKITPITHKIPEKSH